MGNVRCGASEIFHTAKEKNFLLHVEFFVPMPFEEGTNEWPELPSLPHEGTRVSMELTSTQRIARPRNEVWTALNDTEILKRCIPGCEMLERLSERELTVKVVLKIGPVKATFTGKVRFENVVEPVSLTLSGEGSGGIAGHARGGADVSLTEDGDGTILTYRAKADVGGRIAQLGARLIQSTSQKLAVEFFSKFEKEVSTLAAA